MKCSVEHLLDLIGDKWTLRILHELLAGARRTQTLLDELSGISSRTLAAKLKQLESLGLVRRNVFAEVPPRVEYELTEKGDALREIYPALRKAGEQLLGKRAASLFKRAHCPCCDARAAREKPVEPIRVDQPIRSVRTAQSRKPTIDVTLL